MTLLRTYIIFLIFFTTGHLERFQDFLEKTELEMYIKEKKTEINPRYKLHYHITPPVGWMSGPTGFIYYRGEYHVFYQYYPYDTQWGPLHWGHVVSSDLVEWRQMPTALLPATEQCFPGCAIVSEDVMALIYTGHVASEEPPYYKESQYLAFSTDGIEFQKYRGNPILLNPPLGIQELRDPKVWKYGMFWYAVLGSKTESQEGAALLYRSINMISWEYLTVLAKSNGDLGFMWECPDFFELDGKFILLISPQGVIPHGDRYKNSFQTGYIIGSFDYETYDFEPEVSFQEMDFGHDFYATQTTIREGKRYLIAWLGMWEATHPEDVDGWVGAMTLFRELNLVGTRILMKPVAAIDTLRHETVIEGELGQNSCMKFEQTGEIIVNLDLSENIELDIRGSRGGERATVRWDADDGKVMLERAGEVRRVIWEPLDKVIWRIFLDASSIELFCGEGEVVFSSRIYPKGYWVVRNLGPESLHVVAYTLIKIMPEWIV